MRISVSRARLSLLAAGIAVALAACGGDDGPGTAANDPGTAPGNDSPPAASPGGGAGGDGTGDDTPGGGNTSPTIQGTPQPIVLQNTPYVFQPEADDGDGDILHFSIVNAPAWAEFEKTTGRLQGTPSPEHVGTYDDIVIAVTDGAADAALEPFSITVTATTGGAAELSWDAPTQNEDGTTLSDLAGYKIYWGTEPDEFTSSVTIDNPAVLTYVLEDLVPATYYFVATAFNSEGSESDPSDTATLTIS